MKTFNWLVEGGMVVAFEALTFALGLGVVYLGLRAFGVHPF